MLSQPEPAPDPVVVPVSPDDRALVLPANCTTVTAEGIGVRLVLASDLDGVVDVDASGVESIGQATLQLLVAARAHSVQHGQRFAILNPSPAFVERVTLCRLADAIGLETRKEATA